MHFTPTLLPALALALGAASAPCEDKYQPPAAVFQPWITSCGDTGGHTMGTNQVYPKYKDLCLPLPDNIRALDVSEISEGCKITAFESPVCDDYPYNGAWIDKVGCLWTGNREYRSYKLTCDETAE